MTSPADRAAAILAELPPGTLELGSRLLESANRRLEPDRTVDSSPSAVADHLLRPIELAEHWPDPTDPLPVGDGAVHADLIDDDRELFGALRAAANADATELPDAEVLAERAQACRLPVTPYRRRCQLDPVGAGHSPAPGSHRSAAALLANRAPTECRVLDLSALWAGPLATSLLAAVGVEVIKVDPSCRRDAFAGHPRLYDHLNGDKEIVDLDLRVDDDRSRFESLLASSDLVVDSFSRRVMPNLGYGPEQLRALHPAVASLSIVAFDPSEREADWVAYGPGVHAMSGLAERVDPETDDSESDDPDLPRFRAAPIAYPDLLAGLWAFAEALELLLLGRTTTHRTVALSSAIAPLVAPCNDDSHR